MHWKKLLQALEVFSFVIKKLHNRAKYFRVFEFLLNNDFMSYLLNT